MKYFAIVALLCLNLAAHAQNGVQLLQHQKTPIDYLLQNDDVKGLIVNHYMGTGKTFLGIGFAEHFKKKSVIILAPRFIESHWLEHLRSYPVADLKRYEFVSYNDAPKILMQRDLSNTILLMDEVHNLTKLIKSADPATNRRYSDLYEHLRGSFKILALSGTPIYSDEYDLAYLINLVSGKDLMPFNEEQFRIQFTRIKKARSFWRGYVFESNILQQTLPMAVVVGSVPLFFVAGAALATPVLIVGSVGSMLAFPIVNNWLAPIETGSLRELNITKFRPYVSKYISFYEIENQDLSEFPSKSIRVEEVGYNAEQFWFFLNFAEKSLGNKALARLYKDVDADVDQAYLTLNTTILQTRLADTLGAGREIGNLDFEGEGSLIEAPKFLQVLKKIKSAGIPKTVVYSNYFENGTVAFARFLDRYGLKDAYEILRPDLAPEKFAELVKRYNDGKIKILLLHPEINEGISLKGTRQFHILEPVTNATLLNQVIARAVRYQSHSALPSSERHVDVYVWKAIIGSMSLQTLKLQKANWFKRYSELSDWSNFGQGISQIDKNYDRKRLSPDSQTYMRLESVNDNMDALKTIMKGHSIEKPNEAKDDAPLTPMTAFEEEKESVELDPIVLPKTNLRLMWRFGQQLVADGVLNRREPLNDYFGLNLEIEMPIWDNFASGFYLEGYKGHSVKKLETDTLDEAGDMARKLGGQIAFGFGGFLKPQYKLPVSFGNFALSLRIPIGFEVLFGQSLIPLFKDQADIDQFKQRGADSARVGYFSSKVGYGITTGATLGLEYFPIEFAGVVIEGGYNAAYHMFPLQVRQEFSGRPDETSNATWRGYLIHGWNAMAGLKVTY